jgi:hypothetical protein
VEGLVRAAVTATRLSKSQLNDHLVLESALTRSIVRELRRMILEEAPNAAEAVRFRCLCYSDPEADFGSIGGNICLIETRQGKVALSFLHGTRLADPHSLLQGRAKSKRFVPVASLEQASDPRLRRLVRAAAELKPWDP